MDPLSQVLAGLEGAWWVLWSVPAVPAATDPRDFEVQVALGACILLGLCGWWLFAGA